MKHKLFVLLTALALMWGMALPTLAAETGSMRVSLGQEGQVTQGGSVTIYRVGTPISGGYRLSEAYGGGVVAWEDVYSVALAAWLAELAEYGGTELLLDADGYADFTGLTEGLYLLVQEQPTPGYYPMAPFVVSLPYEGQWDIQANPEQEPLPEVNPRTGQSPLPVFACFVMLYSGLGVAILVRKRKLLEEKQDFSSKNA